MEASTAVIFDPVLLWRSGAGILYLVCGIGYFILLPVDNV